MMSLSNKNANGGSTTTKRRFLRRSNKKQTSKAVVEKQPRTLVTYDGVDSLSSCGLEGSIRSGQSNCSSSTGRRSRPSHNTSTSFNDTYELISQEKLGYGIAGQVMKCYHRSTSHLCAVKVINKANVRRQDRLKREMKFLKQISNHPHPNIIRMYDCYEDEDTVYIVTECCHGGELFDKILKKAKRSATMKRKLMRVSSKSSSSGRMINGGSNSCEEVIQRQVEPSCSTYIPACFHERDAARIIHSLLSAVSYLHSNDIIHRDIKPENILFVDKEGGDKEGNDSPSIKLIDFGLSVRHTPNCPPLSNTVGTSYYMAPELLNGSYDRACDLWSVGVVAYVMLSGRPPFNGSNDEIIFKKIRRGNYKMGDSSDDSGIWDGVSEYAKDFINCLLCMDPKKRWTADMALEHAWFRLAMQEDVEFAELLLSSQ